MVTITIIKIVWACIIAINMYKPKQLYTYKHNNLACHVCDDDCFNNEECDLKIENCNRNMINQKRKYCKWFLKYECECIKYI